VNVTNQSDASLSQLCCRVWDRKKGDEVCILNFGLVPPKQTVSRQVFLNVEGVLSQGDLDDLVYDWSELNDNTPQEQKVELNLPPVSSGFDVTATLMESLWRKMDFELSR